MTTAISICVPVFTSLWATSSAGWRVFRIHEKIGMRRWDQIDYTMRQVAFASIFFAAGMAIIHLCGWAS